MYRRNRCMEETSELLRLSLRRSVRGSRAERQSDRCAADYDDRLRTAFAALGAALSAAALSYPLWG